MTTGQLTKIIESMPLQDEERRRYIGASLIGSECLRQIWYEFTGAPSEPLPHKLRRTFDIGKSLEHLIKTILIKANLTIECNPFETWFSDRDLKYFQGNADAILLDLNAILEIKTAKEASFKQFVNCGLKKWNPRYYAQVQSYMGMSGISNAYILVLNKDNSDIWDELVSFDLEFYESLRNKAKLVYEATSPPPRISGSPLWYQCKACKYRKICHE